MADIESEKPVEVPFSISMKQRALVAVAIYFIVACVMGGMSLSRLYSHMSGEAQMQLMHELSLPVHPQRVLRISWSHDGSRLATGCMDGVARIWDTQGNLVKSAEFESGLYGLYDIAWHPDGHILAVLLWGAYFSKIVIWDIQTEQTWTLAEGSPPMDYHTVAWSPDGSLLASEGPNGTTVWNAANGQVISRVPDLSSTGLSWSCSGLLGLAGGWNTSGRTRKTEEAAFILDPHETGFLQRLSLGAFDPAYHMYLDWSPDGSILAGCVDTSIGPQPPRPVGTILLWNASNGNLIRYFSKAWTNSLSWSPDGRYIIAAAEGRLAEDGANAEVVHDLMMLWDAAGGNVIDAVASEEGYVFDQVSWSSAGKIASLSDSFGTDPTLSRVDIWSLVKR